MSDTTQSMTGIPLDVATGDSVCALPQGDEQSTVTGLTDQTGRSVKVMIVDDEEFNISLIQAYLEDAGYHEFVACSDSTQALDLIRENRPDLILLDIMMPQVDGLEILEKLRQFEEFRNLPVLILTASKDEQVERKALELGATDFLSKPVRPSQLAPRVRNALTVKAHHDHLEHHATILKKQVRIRTAELAESRQDLIRCLALAGEYRDDDTGHHVIRVGLYAGIIARELGFDDDFVDLLEKAAELHDVGKIGIPDAVLLKPGKLDSDEFEIMKKHAEIGRTIIQPKNTDELSTQRKHVNLEKSKTLSASQNAVVTMAALIAETHHEKWNGSGYPKGLAGEEIPIEGRITAVADVFDALGSKRPYKDAFPLAKCIAILKEGHGSHFDPRVLDAFFRRQEKIRLIRVRCADND